MAPTALKKLVALQDTRQKEIKGLHERLLAKDRTSLNKSIVQARIDSLKEIWAEARKTNAEITVREAAEADLYVVVDGFRKLQGVYESALDELLTLRSQLELGDEPTVPWGPLNSTVSNSGVESPFAKLPRIPLHTFSGKYEDWESFCDLFTTLVHDQPRISESTKLQYLKLCVTGTAADLIKDVTITNANYASTWEALKSRYHNPRLIINKHLSALMELPHLKRESA